MPAGFVMRSSEQQTQEFRTTARVRRTISTMWYKSPDGQEIMQQGLEVYNTITSGNQCISYWHGLVLPKAVGIQHL